MLEATHTPTPFLSSLLPPMGPEVSTSRPKIITHQQNRAKIVLMSKNHIKSLNVNGHAWQTSSVGRLPRRLATVWHT